MPYRRRRRYAKRRSGRAGKKYRKRTYTKINKNVISDLTQVKLKYVTQFTLDPGTGAAATKEIWANIANNPEDAAGHQPMGWDQWSTFYDAYTVLGSKCSVIFHTTSSTNSAQNIVAIRLLDYSKNPVISSVTDLLEQRGVTYKAITNITSEGTCKLSKCFSSKKTVGTGWKTRSKGATSSTVQTLSLFDDSAKFAFEIMLLPAAATQDPVAVFCTATVSYIVQFYEPQSLSGS